MYQFVGKLNCLIEGNNLNSQKSICEKISRICSSMACVHQFLISYLNSNNLDNSFTENNNAEQQPPEARSHRIKELSKACGYT